MVPLEIEIVLMLSLQVELVGRQNRITWFYSLIKVFDSVLPFSVKKKVSSV